MPENTVPTLFILRGIQASGKTTFAKQWLSEHSDRRRSNRDTIRYDTYGVYYGPPIDENAVTRIQHWQIRQWLGEGHNVIVDDTNLRERTVKDLMKIAREMGAFVDYKDFPVSVETAISRDDARADRGERSVGAQVIMTTYNRFLAQRKGALPPFPTLAEEPEFRVYEGTPGAPPAVICDLDGTLCLFNGRQPYDESRVEHDLVNEAVRLSLVAYRALGWQVILTSGRTDGCYDATAQWLKEHQIHHTALFMRKTGDRRKDAVIKHEIFWEHIAHRWDVKVVLDDRNQVVNMWRAIALPTFQVAPGDF